MTYNELKNRVEHTKACRASWRNREKLANKGVACNGVYEFKGADGKRYRVQVLVRRDYIMLVPYDNHRLSTIEKWCGDSVGHLVDIM